MLCNPSEADPQDLVSPVSHKWLTLQRKPTRQQRSEGERMCLWIVTGGSYGGRAGEETRGEERRRQVVHVEVSCDWWMMWVERMTGKMRSIFSFHSECFFCPTLYKYSEYLRLIISGICSAWTPWTDISNCRSFNQVRLCFNWHWCIHRKIGKERHW